MTERSVFLAALDIADAAGRAAYLDQACAADADLRRRVEALLAAHAASGTFMAHPAAEDDPRDATGEFTQAGPVPFESGLLLAERYRLLGPIGEGGMGTVYRAEQVQPVKRMVAVKLIKPGMDTRTVLARFEAERQALALMDHPHIAKVFDAGATPDGRPFFVMELVEGVPLTDYCDTRRLTVPDRLALFRQVCAAVQHAHQKGIIHRDLKPSNVLVAEQDGKPVPKVIDFGLAKAVGGTALTEHSLLTGYGAILGTPLYMAPEQATFQAADVDTRADVYALGVILYELLTGTTPITRVTLRAAAMEEMLKLIREQDPPTPSSRLSAADGTPGVAASRQTEPAQLGRFVRGELDWIVMKALSKERGRRYDSAGGFATDVEHFLNHEPVQAGPTSAAYRARKFVRRNRAAVTAAGLVVTALVAGVVGTTWGLVQAERQRGEADEARGREKERADAAETAEAAERRAKEDVTRGKEELQKTNDALVKANAAEQAARAVAQQAEDAALQILVEGTNDAVRNLIGSKAALGPQETAYLEGMVKRWRMFADRTGDDDRSRLVRASAHQQLGLLWGQLGLHDRAEADFRAACDLLEKLTADQPDRRGVLVVCLHQLSLAERAQYKLKEAEKRLRRVLDLLRPDGPWAGQVPDRLDKSASAHIDLGAVLDEGDKRKDAEKEYRNGLTECDQLLAAKPDDRAVQVTRGTGLTNLGLLLGDTDRPDEAEGLFREAVRQYAALAKAEPGSPHYRADLAGVHTHLGQLLRVKREFGESEAELRAGLAILVKLAADYPAVPTFRAKLAVTHGHLGLLLADRKKVDAAATEYKAGVAIQEKLIAEQPKATGYQVEMAGGCCNLGELLRANGQSADSLEWFDKAVKALTPLVQDANEDPLAKQFLFNSHWRRALARGQVGKHADAVADWDRVLALVDPSGRLPFRVERMASLAAAGKGSEAVAEADALLKRAGWSGGQFVQFAGVYAVASVSVEGKADEYAPKAVELLTKATKGGFKDVARLKADKQLDPLRDRDGFKKLLAELEKDAPTAKEPAPKPPEKK